jgi:hypothetical protein
MEPGASEPFRIGIQPPMISSDTVIYPAPQQQNYFIDCSKANLLLHDPNTYMPHIGQRQSLLIFTEASCWTQPQLNPHTASLITCGELKPSAPIAYYPDISGMCHAFSWMDEYDLWHPPMKKDGQLLKFLATSYLHSVVLRFLNPRLLFVVHLRYAFT